MVKYQNRHIRQVERATKQWEARANKVANNNNKKSVQSDKTTQTTERNTIESDENFHATRSRSEALSDSRGDMKRRRVFLQVMKRMTSMFFKHEVNEMYRSEITRQGQQA